MTLAAGNNIDLASSRRSAGARRSSPWRRPKRPTTLHDKLKQAGSTASKSSHGISGTVKVATHPEVDFVVSAIVGVAGLEATYEAVKAGKTVGLANKECLVAAGELITAEAARQGKPLLPIDSEHNAIHQCMRGGRREEVRTRLAYGLRRPVPEHATLANSPNHRGAGAEPSHVEDGPAHHDRLGHADEQRI